MYDFSADYTVGDFGTAAIAAGYTARVYHQRARKEASMKASVSISIVLTSSLTCVAELNAQLVEPRTLTPRAGQRLVEVVRAGDPPTVVIDPADPGLHVLPGPGTSMLEWQTQLAGAILIIDVVERKSRLTDRGDWVECDVAAVVSQILKAPPGSARIGQRISFVEGGGELVVNNTAVSAVTPGARAIRVGRRYLAFGATHPRTGAVLIGPSTAYELVGNNRFVRLQDTGQADDNIEQLPAQEVIAMISQYVERQR